MQTSRSPRWPGRSFNAKILWLAIVLSTLVLVVVGAWLVGARLYQGAVDEGIVQLAEQGVRVECAEQTLGGFPARFEVGCSSLAWGFETGSTVSGHAVKTVTMAWDPMLTIIEWSGPFRANTPEGFDVRIDSELLRSSVNVNSALDLERLSAVLDPFAITLQDAPQPIVLGQGSELHIRQPSGDDMAEMSDDNDLQIVLTALGLKSPVLSGVNDIGLSLTLIADELAAVQASSVQEAMADWVDRSGEFRAFMGRLQLDDHAIDLDGHGALSADGRLSFEGTVATNDIATLIQLLGVDTANAATAITAAINLFGQRVEVDGQGAIQLPVTIRQGAITIGPILVGVIPAMRL